MERGTARMEDSADRRTELAADRTVFAAERTYAAWVRTGLVAMASGIGAKPLLSGLVPEWLIRDHRQRAGAVQRLLLRRRGLAQSPPWAAAAGARCARIHPAVLIVVNGFLALVALAALIGIWFGRVVA